MARLHFWSHDWFFLPIIYKTVTDQSVMIIQSASITEKDSLLKWKVFLGLVWICLTGTWILSVRVRNVRENFSKPRQDIFNMSIIPVRFSPSLWIDFSDLDEFYFRWLENIFIEIGKAVSNPLKVQPSKMKSLLVVRNRVPWTKVGRQTPFPTLFNTSSKYVGQIKGFIAFIACKMRKRPFYWAYQYVSNVNSMSNYS